jgi:amidase
MKKLLILLILLIPFNIDAYYQAPIDITEMNIYEIQDTIEDGYLTYEVLMHLYLDRISEYNDQYNAIRITNKNAIAEAKKMDLDYQKNGFKSLLHGIPVIVKDNIDVYGFPTTAGSKALLETYPKDDATIIEYLKDSGAIIIGKSNMSEFAFSARNSFSSFGSVKNAFDLAKTPFGSSGGSAVSIAALFSPIALGTDTNSSIRFPASGNNVVGIRPTYDLISTDGIISYDKERDVVGPITKNVTDNAITLTILNNNKIDYTKSLKDDGLKDKRVGVITDFINKQASSVNALNGYDEDIAKLTNAALDKMEAAGAILVDIDPFYNSYYQNINNKTIMGRLLCYDFNQYLKGTNSNLNSYEDLLATRLFVQNLYEYNISCNTDIRTNELAAIDKQKEEYRNYVLKIMNDNDLDVLVYPSSKTKIPNLNDNTSLVINLTSTIAPTTGFPAINLPMGFIDDLPYGIEFLARPNNEELLYEVGYSYEQLEDHTLLPSIASKLYYVSDYTSNLITLYETSDYDESDYTKESYLEYIQVKEEVLEYINNYQDYSESLSLYNKLEASINNLEVKKSSFYWYLLLLIPVYIVYKKKRHK